MGAIPYSYQQIKNTLKEHGLRLEKLWIYKERITKYDILDKEGTILIHKLSLNQLRWIFTIAGVPIDSSNPPDQTKEEKQC
ncbi:hypothetical protein [Roseburia sp. 499]|uniref:hypothetical protein n=1 Tax=Roseburia sp. 499 TaxID=1261634 RepID=UPI0009518631|nr:hypothetical protein [Roseburia sp. 499]WVK69386.1 hypothetical protein BIV20_13625 [Roseburia sp. 499]